MNRILAFLEGKLAPLGERIGKQRHLKALREGIMMAMPLVLLGSFFVLIKDFPIQAWIAWLHSHWNLDVLLNTMANNSFGLMALVTAFGIAYRLSESYGTDGPSAGVISLGAFLLMTPPLAAEDGALGIPYGMLGGKGIFAAIVVAMISAEIYRWFIQKNIAIKMPAGVPDVVSKSFSALIPGIVILTFFAVVLKVIEATGLGSLNAILSIVVGKPLGLIASTLPGTFVAVLLNSLFLVLWCQWWTGSRSSYESSLDPVCRCKPYRSGSRRSSSKYRNSAVYGPVCVYWRGRCDNRSGTLPDVFQQEQRIQNTWKSIWYSSVI